MSGPIGRFRDPESAKQLCLFEGFYHEDGCYPTDIDYARDYLRQRLFIYGDAKHGLETELTEGQKIHAQALAEVFRAAEVTLKKGLRFVYFVANHETKKPDPFYGADCIITKVLENGEWVDTYNDMRAADFEHEMIQQAIGRLGWSKS